MPGVGIPNGVGETCGASRVERVAKAAALREDKSEALARPGSTRPPTAATAPTAPAVLNSDRRESRVLVSGALASGMIGTSLLSLVMLEPDDTV
jgi:hypothetical protein